MIQTPLPSESWSATGQTRVSVELSRAGSSAQCFTACMLNSKSQNSTSALSRKPTQQQPQFIHAALHLTQVNFLFQVAVSHSTSTPLALQISLLSLHLSKRKRASAPDLQIQICLNPNKNVSMEFEKACSNARSLFQPFFFLSCFSTRLFYIQLVRTKRAGRFLPSEHLPPHGSQHVWLPGPRCCHCTLMLRRLSSRNAAESSGMMWCLK